MSDITVEKYIETRVLNKPFGKFSVQGYDAWDTELKVTFFGVKSVPCPRWRYLDVYGGWAYPWFEHATFETLSEAKLFAEWVNKEKVIPKK